MNKVPLQPFNYDFVLQSLKTPDNENNSKQKVPHPDANWVFNNKPPLFWEPLSTHSIEVKLSNMKTALLSGADPNEMDHEPDNRRSYGRPLHCTLGDGEDPEYTRQNIPVIELLLQHGADPRLSGPKVIPAACGMGSPLLYASRLACLQVQGDDGELFKCVFYEEAYRLLKCAADELDRHDAAKKRREFVEWLLSFFKKW